MVTKKQILAIFLILTICYPIITPILFIGVPFYFIYKILDEILFTKKEDIKQRFSIKNMLSFGNFEKETKQKTQSKKESNLSKVNDTQKVKSENIEQNKKTEEQPKKEIKPKKQSKKYNLKIYFLWLLPILILYIFCLLLPLIIYCIPFIFLFKTIRLINEFRLANKKNKAKREILTIEQKLELNKQRFVHKYLS